MKYIPCVNRQIHEKKYAAGFEAGSDGKAHTHIQCSYVLAGKFTYTVDGGDIVRRIHTCTKRFLMGITG